MECPWGTNGFLFADDTASIADSEENISTLVEEFEEGILVVGNEFKYLGSTVCLSGGWK